MGTHTIVSSTVCTFKCAAHTCKAAMAAWTQRLNAACCVCTYTFCACFFYCNCKVAARWRYEPHEISVASCRDLT